MLTTRNNEGNETGDPPGRTAEQETATEHGRAPWRGPPPQTTPHRPLGSSENARNVLAGGVSELNSPWVPNPIPPPLFRLLCPARHAPSFEYSQPPQSGSFGCPSVTLQTSGRVGPVTCREQRPPMRKAPVADAPCNKLPSRHHSSQDPSGWPQTLNPRHQRAPPAAQLVQPQPPCRPKPLRP